MTDEEIAEAAERLQTCAGPDPLGPWRDAGLPQEGAHGDLFADVFDEMEARAVAILADAERVPSDAPSRPWVPSRVEQYANAVGVLRLLRDLTQARTANGFHTPAEGARRCLRIDALLAECDRGLAGRTTAVART